MAAGQINTLAFLSALETERVVFLIFSVTVKLY